MTDKSKPDEEYPDRYVGDGSKVEQWETFSEGKRYPDAWWEARAEQADQAERVAMIERKDEIETLEEISRLLAWKLEQASDETVSASVREKTTRLLMREVLKDNDRLRAERMRGWPSPSIDDSVMSAVRKLIDDDNAEPDFLVDRLTEERNDARATATRYMEEAELAKALLSPLKKIAERMDGQDNRATADPIFIVQQRRRIYGFDTDWCGGNQAWLYEGSEVARTEEGLERFLYDNELTKEECSENRSLVETGYNDIFEFVQPFFSMKAAENYIETNRHNLTDPRVYVDTAYRNEEWQAVRGVLLGMVEKGSGDA